MSGYSERRDSPELTQSVVRACELLKGFAYEGELLRLRDLTARTSYRKTTAYRLLCSLEEGGLVERVGKDRYRSRIKPIRSSRFRVGFATLRSDCSFCALANASVERAAKDAGIELLIVDNQQSPTVAVRNAEKLTRESVDLVIEFQVHERVVATVASRFLEAGIPVVAIDVPQPRASYYGADNYRAGYLGGRGLAQWADQHWRGQVEELMFLGMSQGGSLPRLRLTGALAALREELPGGGQTVVTELDGRGDTERSFEAVRRHLRSVPPRRTLIAAATDTMALGALRAFNGSGRSECCAVAGQNASPEACEEMQRPGSRLVASVAYFPERYGDELIPLVLEILTGKSHSFVRYIKHELITSGNVSSFCPSGASRAPALGSRPGNQSLEKHAGIGV